MADRKVVEVKFGPEVHNPQLGLKLKVIGNSKGLKEHLQSLPNFDPNGAYFFVEIKSSSPSELRNAFDEFLTTGLSMAKEMSEEVGQIAGESAFHVIIHGDTVVAALNLKENPLANEQISQIEKFTADVLKGEAVFEASILLDKNINEILNLTETQMDTVKGQFAVTLTSSKEDKYAIKKKFIDTTFPPNARSRDKIAKLLFLMFNSVHISVQSESQVSFSAASGRYLNDGKKMAEEYIAMAKELYSGNKEMVDSFPFVQAFFDAVDQHGAGVVSLGLYHKDVAGEVDLHGRELGVLYHKIVN